ncbi:MAG: hypothetical protein IPP79_24300 [Chitinophagaceae bacterium]|nr:hypothetical protein [Chitinophagaceae bacterium]
MDTGKRRIYYADPIDANYVTPLSMADPDEPAQKAGLVVADYGKGKFVYTGLVFFHDCRRAFRELMD